MTDQTDLESRTLADWVGRESIETDEITAGQVRGLVATLASRMILPQPGDAAPLLAHWIYFLPYTPLDEVGPDGHPRRGGFLPPVALPRRMWAGSTIAFHRPLQIGSAVTRRSVIGDVVEKHGRTGGLVFVRVDHEVRDAGGLVLTDSHNIVYREAPDKAAPPPPPQPAPLAPEWKRRVFADPVMLFRYSALTFNGHRIHYDRSYVTEVEGYPGLIVHGPLIATMLLHDLIERFPDRDVAAYSFRAFKPIFDIEPFFLCGSIGDDGKAHLFACDEAGALCMSATATFR